MHLDENDRRNIIRLILSVAIGLFLIGTSYFNSFHIGLLERIIIVFIGLTIMIMF